MSAKKLKVGTLVVNERTGRVCVAMEQVGETVYLRPVGGGRETTVKREAVRIATRAEALAARVAAANRRSRAA